VAVDVTVQKLWRRSQARLLSYSLAAASVRRIQAFVRRVLRRVYQEDDCCRCQHPEWQGCREREIHYLALVSAAYRVYTIARDLVKRRTSAASSVSLVRGALTRSRQKKLTATALILQKRWRGYRARESRYLALVAVCRFQVAFRDYRMTRELLERRTSAALLIQKHLRGYFACSERIKALSSIRPSQAVHLQGVFVLPRAHPKRPIAA
jgi:hypothetical protein